MKLYSDAGRYFIVGRTYPHRALLRKSGAHWDRVREAWWLTDRNVANRLLRALRALSRRRRHP